MEEGNRNVKIQHGYVRRLALTPEQVDILDGQGHAARAMWNLLHDWSTGHGHCHRRSNKDADEAIRQARKDTPWLADLPAQAAQQVLKTYRRAWTNFFEGRADPPEFKVRFRSRLAIDVPQARDLAVKRLSRHQAQVRIPKAGAVRFRWSGPIPGVGREPGRVTGARLVKDALGWHVVFRAERNVPDPQPHPGPSVGVDRGVNVALALSDGNDQTHGEWHRPKEAGRLLRLERKAARQKRAAKRGQPTPNRLTRTYDQIAGLRARAKRRRLNWQHQTTTAIARLYGTVVVEDLQLKNMTRSATGTVDQPGTNVRQKAGLNRSMLNEAHARTVELLTYKLVERGGQLLKVPAPHTSTTCSQCGHRDSSSRKGVKFSCTRCRWVGHADTNAALNIKYAVGRTVYGRGAAAVGRGCEASTTRIVA